jgi:hypothetical protein
MSDLLLQKILDKITIKALRMHIGRRRGCSIENYLYTPRPQCKKYDKRSSDTMILNFVNAVYA